MQDYSWDIDSMYDRRDELVNIAEMHRRVRAKEAELEEQMDLFSLLS